MNAVFFQQIMHHSAIKQNPCKEQVLDYRYFIFKTRIIFLIRILHHATFFYSIIFFFFNSKWMFLALLVNLLQEIVSGPISLLTMRYINKIFIKNL